MAIKADITITGGAVIPGVYINLLNWHIEPHHGFVTVTPLVLKDEATRNTWKTAITTKATKVAERNALVETYNHDTDADVESPYQQQLRALDAEITAANETALAIMNNPVVQPAPLPPIPLAQVQDANGEVTRALIYAAVTAMFPGAGRVD